MSCREELEVAPEPADGGAGPVEARKGVLRVRLSEEAARSLSITESRGVVETGDAAWDEVARGMGVYRMRRAFPPAGKFEERHRQWGLHLWYDIYFDKEVSTRSAGEELMALDGVEVVENIYVPHVDAREVPEPLLAPAQVRVPLATAEEMPFDDPRLPEQWHYHNTGAQVSPSVAGADINLFEAWKVETGSRNVIVAVLDEGVDVNHEDLAANIWVNEGEIPNNGADDDNNGYVDDVNGYNFYTKKPYIKPMTHGTHVAGTIGAVNDNGIGISSIAGGTRENPGARIMVCQMMEDTTETLQGNLFDAFVYAADNGASIAQCSWSYGEWDKYYNQSQITAMEYFIANAGIGTDGTQTGPMRGGLIVFAAANDAWSQKTYPASYENVVAVTAFGPDLRHSYFANYGDWVDIAAPGGNGYAGGVPNVSGWQNAACVLSLAPNNAYAWAHGTSQAAPHVSGIAALILSNRQGAGFTAYELRNLLLGSARPELYNYNPDMAGLLGAGYADAAAALQTDAGHVGPERTEMKVVAAYNDRAVLEWTVAADEDDGSAFSYRLEWEAADAKLPGGERTYSVMLNEAGDVMRDTVEGLRLGITYRFTLTGYDRWGNASEPASTERLVEYNAAPEVERLWTGNVFLDETSAMELPFRVSDREGHAWTASLAEELDWVTLTSGDGTLTLRLAPGYGDAAEGVMTLVVTDEHGAAATVAVPYEVRHVSTVPQLVGQLPDVAMAVGDERRVLLEDYFRDERDASLSYEVESSDRGVCAARISGKYLVLRGEAAGYAMVLVRAVNSDGRSVSSGFRVDVSETTNME